MTSWEIFQGNQEPHDGLERLPDPPSWRQFQDRQKTKGQTYRARPEEIALVNAALYLRRPLLITGKPGIGKTSLAYAVAHELKMGEVLSWSITTRTTLKDGLYNYDAIARLQDSQQNQSPNPSSEQQREQLEKIGRYIRLGPLGTALLPVVNAQKPRILLIDEIDKSDIDLPNDLLHVFEEGRYRIPELERLQELCPKVSVSTAYESQEASFEIENGLVQSNAFPFVILTSNGERDFPPAFLRRCIRLNMEKPDGKMLAEIVQQHLDEAGVSQEAADSIEAFLKQRDDKGEEIATDQLLNAIYLLEQNGIPGDAAGRAALRQKLLKPLSGPNA